MNIYDMIYNGNFGTNQPMNYGSSNMVPFGYSGYNQAMPEQYVPQYQQPQYVQPQYIRPQYQQPNYQPVFQPLPQQPNYSGTNYYNPYSGTFSQPGYSAGYNNGYYAPMQFPQTIQNDINIELIKRKIVYDHCHKDFDEDKERESITKKYDPRTYEKEMSFEERQVIDEYRYTLQIHRAFQDPRYKPPGWDYCCNWINEWNKMEQLQGHGLVQFLTEDLWQLQREYFVEEYIMPKHYQLRDLSQTYNSTEYNQLLALHASNQNNPYVSQLMDDSRYDNNVFDEPIGINSAAEREHARVQRLREMLPLLSDEETVKRRKEWTDEIARQIIAKGGGNVVV